MVYVWGLATIIDSSSREDKYKIAVARAILQSRALVKSENPGGGASSKVEKILKGSLDLIPSNLQWKFKLWAGKFAWGVKVKYCWALSTTFEN